MIKAYCQDCDEDSTFKQLEDDAEWFECDNCGFQATKAELEDEDGDLEYEDDDEIELEDEDE